MSAQTTLLANFLQVGSIRSTSASSILKKNIGDATISLVAWVLVGYALSDGKDQLRIVGGSYFGLVQGENSILPVLVLTICLRGGLSDALVALGCRKWGAKDSFKVSGEPFEATDDRDVGTALLECLFRWSFAATCTTIVSDAFLTSAVFYPLLAHAAWADEGWASPFLTSEGESAAWLNCGVVDFAGSGVVHMLGGGIGLVLSMVVDNRSDRFIDANPQLVERNKSATLDRRLFKVSHNLLSRGRYGFNCGSTLQISTEETRNAAGRAALNTTIGAGENEHDKHELCYQRAGWAVGCVSSMGFEIMYHWWSPEYRRREFINDPLDYMPQARNTLAGELSSQDPRRRRTTGSTDDAKDPEDEHNSGKFRWRLSTHKSIHGAACNGVLVGLVGVTAGCATMHPWHAIWVSIVSALVYHVSYRGIICCNIDDAINAAAVHLVGGLWGVVAAGLTVDNAARVDLGFPGQEDGCTPENQAWVNVLMAVIIFGYVSNNRTLYLG
ncbi:unnamed protein product [Ectocarpus sp. CCAP 1310/34]|nr:unnamed protein product [Ectocarpus sp. CCAP 1310/34]